MRHYKFLPLIAGIFTSTLIITNILNTKIFVLLGFSFPAGILTFPLSFLAADALTETYGYRVTRQVIWSGFIALLLMAGCSYGAIYLQPAPFWNLQNSFANILQQIPRIVLASILAYWAGEFCNSYVLARSKVKTNGKGMWVRFVSSTMVGQAVDTTVFMIIAFLGVFPPQAMVTLLLSSWVLKVLWELIALPVSIPLVRKLKLIENEDYFDRGTNFNPFKVIIDTKSE
jgi:queuosine precursor transporter